MVRLEMTADGHNKFWTIEQCECETIVTYGAIGAKPRESHAEHKSVENAAKWMNHQIQAKKKKGYTEADEGPQEPAAKRSRTDGGDKATIRLEYRGDGHNKFWQITVDGSNTVVEYGAIGAEPRLSEREHSSAEAAEKFKLSKVGKKKREGYSEVGAAPAPDGQRGGDPQLFVFGEPCSALELEKRHDDWCGPDIGGSSDLCAADIMHGKMSDAPAASKEIAELLQKAMPNLQDTQMMMSSESSDGGEVIVISSPGDDPKVACLKALAMKQGNLEAASKAATLLDMNWRDHAEVGFNRDPDEEFLPDEEFEDMEEDRQMFDDVLKGTGIMNDKLVKHFLFNFLDSFSVAPVIYGGYASDGNIVGILSSRVWT